MKYNLDDSVLHSDFFEDIRFLIDFIHHLCPPSFYPDYAPLLSED